LCALGFGFFENPNAFELLWQVEQQSDALRSSLSSTPAPRLPELQRTFNGVGFIFRCDFDRRQVGQIQLATINRYTVVREGRN
jgi:hypothetical protein